MIRIKQYIILIFLIAVQTVFSQEHSENHHGHKIVGGDTNKRTLGTDLDKGLFEFHARSFFMQTNNKGDLLNYNAMGVGAGISYYSPSWKGFHFGFSGFFVFQLFENNIYKEDPITSNTNRYEVLLFDMNDLDNKRDLDRLEELYLNYEYKNLDVLLGRQKFESPLMNEQDNRMRANLFNGLKVRYSPENWLLKAAWFNQVTIRGTVDWYSMEESYGVYPFGRNPFGTPSQYKGNISTLGVGVIGTKYHKENFYIEGWNYFNENVFNISFAQSELEIPLRNFSGHLGAQGFYQSAVNEGGNSNQEMSYIMAGESTFGIGGRLGASLGNHQILANSLYISNQGRFLFPREWGREQFFASLPRERFEGSGAVRSLMLKYVYDWEEKGISAEFGAAKVDHAQLSEYSNNKYGIPSYYHFTGLIDYKFSGYLEGLDLKFLVAHKAAQTPNEVPDNFRINRVDLWNFNVILDYRF